MKKYQIMNSSEEPEKFHEEKHSVQLEDHPYFPEHRDFISVHDVLKTVICN